MSDYKPKRGTKGRKSLFIQNDSVSNSRADTSTNNSQRFPSLTRRNKV